MEQKRFSPLKLIAGIVFALITCVMLFRSFTIVVSTISALFGYGNFWSFLQNMCIICVQLLMIVGYLVLAVACFLRNPKKLAMCGVALLLVSILLNSLVSCMDDVVRIFQYGLAFNYITVLNFLCHQCYLLLHLLTFAVALLVLFMKKPNKMLCFVPSVLAVICPVWYIVYNIFVFLIGPSHSDWFSMFMIVVFGAGIIVALLEAVAFAAMLLEVTAKEKEVASADADVIVETPAQEEIPAAE